MKKIIVLALSIISTFAQVGGGRPGAPVIVYGAGGGGRSYSAGTGITIDDNGVISATGTNVAVVVFDTTQFQTNGSGTLIITNTARITNLVAKTGMVADQITNNGLSANFIIIADSTKKETSSSILINGLTNISLGSLTITNQATADNVVITNGVVVGSLTNNSLTASRLTGTDASKKAISIAVGDGLTNSANTLSWAVAAGSNITLTTNNGQITITATGGGGGGGLTGTMLNVGTSIATAIPEYNDTTGTNMVSSKITIIGLTNIAAGRGTFTNGFTSGDGSSVSVETYPVGGYVTNAATTDGLTNYINYIFQSNVVMNLPVIINGITNSSLTATKIVGTDANKKEVSYSVGDGLTNTGGTTISVAITAGANITLTTNNGNITITGSTGAGGTVGTVINTGTPIVNALPAYTDTTGTNVGPTKITVSGLTNLLTGALTVSNSAAIIVVNGNNMTFPASVQTIVGVTTTDTLQNKTEATTGAGGNNTFKTRKFLVLDFDRVALTSMIANTNDFSLNTYGRVGFTGNSALTNNNFVEYSCIVPKYLDTASDLIVEYLQFKTSGTQTGAVTFDIGMADIADSSDADPTSFSNWIAMTSGTLTSAAANDIFTISTKTLTSWRSSLTVGHRLKIRMDRNDTNTDTMNLKNMLISYVDTQ